MSFFNLSPCCVQVGTELPGTPRGVFTPPDKTHQVGRYTVHPADGKNANPKAAVVLFYDVFGFQLVNPKITADHLSDQLGLTVVVPDFNPNAPPPSAMDPIVPHYPGQHSKRSWFSTISSTLYVISKVFYHFGAIREGPQVERGRQAILELKAEGYERLGAIGYCRGGSVIDNLVAQSEQSGIDCAVICHPGPDTHCWPKIAIATEWHLADHDMMFTEAKISQLKRIMDEKKAKGQEVEIVVHKDVTHGFAARPVLSHEPTKKAFEEVHDAAVKFFSRHLISKPSP